MSSSAAAVRRTMAANDDYPAYWYPKLRENVWHIAGGAKADDPTYLVTSKERYELPASYTLNFMKIRPYCTGHHSIPDISERTGVSVKEIVAFFNTFQDIGLLYPVTRSTALDAEEVRDSLMRIVKIWAEELHSVYIASELVKGEGLSKNILIGWMIEMYHYVHDFPAALKHGADSATGKLKTILDRYSSEEVGHEHFVLASLVNMGMDAEEVKASVPLVSTRTIGLLLRELLELEPSATLLAAALLEAADFDEGNIENYKKRLSSLYDIPADALDPYFKHQKIDYDLGHQKLLADNIDLIAITDADKLDEVVNKLHDLKHAFELQGMEIKAYYGEPLNGRYIPRQCMTYDAI